MIGMEFRVGELPADIVERARNHRKLVRMHLARDGHYRDEEMEARVCAEDDCKAECYAYGHDTQTGRQNRASIRCSGHDD